MASYIEDDDIQSPAHEEGCGDGPGNGDWESSLSDDRRVYCPIHQISYWLEDGCESCRLTRASQATDDHANRSSSSVASRDSDPRPHTPGRGSSSAPTGLICGMHPALAEHTLQRCLTAFGGLSGLLVAIQAWEDEPRA
jgi:hypothetical protein